MTTGAVSFAKALQDAGLKHEYNSGKGTESFLLFEGQFSLTVVFEYADDGKRPAFRSAPLCKIPSDKLMEAYIVSNEMNNLYRWVKFVVDDQNELAAQADAITSGGKECVELAGRMFSIIKDAYPEYMELIWGV